ncbi:MAG TPA: hypothetical protein PKB10_04805 [Tepidisphaeraceae bacterium]|nr:hypothetical protein [Tepidisphaeraceae bacterium]
MVIFESLERRSLLSGSVVSLSNGFVYFPVHDDGQIIPVQPPAIAKGGPADAKSRIDAHLLQLADSGVGGSVDVDLAAGDRDALIAALGELGATRFHVAGHLVSAHLPVSAIRLLPEAVPTLRVARAALTHTLSVRDDGQIIPVQSPGNGGAVHSPVRDDGQIIPVQPPVHTGAVNDDGQIIPVRPPVGGGAVYFPVDDHGQIIPVLPSASRELGDRVALALFGDDEWLISR